MLGAFLTAIARRAAIKRYHRATRQKTVPSEMTVALSELEGIVSDGSEVDSELDTEMLGRVISDFVRSLSRRRQFIFIGGYYMAEPIDKLAAELGLSRSMVNKELAEIRRSWYYYVDIGSDVEIFNEFSLEEKIRSFWNPPEKCHC